MTEQAPRRRLAAILAADVVGFSRMMHADEAGTLAALKSRRKEILQPLVAAHHGRVIKVMGDGVLVEFASAVEAVNAALAIHAAMAAANEEISEGQRIVLRIGINLGDVMVEGSDLYGEGVNVAARLEGIAEPGGICVSAKVRDEAAGKIACDFADLGEKALKNIDRPVRVYRVSSGGTAVGGNAPASRPAPDVALAALSIAVLSFDNMSGAPDQGYIGDAIAENIITDLSRFRDLAVIARNSSFAYKGKSVRVEQIRRELGVDYILEGSVQRAGDRIRVTAQLIEAASERHVWAERYDRHADDLFAIMDEVTESIVGALGTTYGGRLRKAASERRGEGSAAGLRAIDCFVRGLEQLEKFTRESVAQSIVLFEQAVALNPRYAKAHAKIAWGHLSNILLGYTADEDLSMSKARSAAEMALSCDDGEAWSHWAIAGCALYAGQNDSAVAAMRRAVELNPNDADILADMALFLSYAGGAQEAIGFALKAMRLNPHYPEYYAAQLGTIYFDARRYEEAARTFASLRKLDAPLWRAYLAATLAALGQEERARSVATALRVAEPAASVAHFTSSRLAPYSQERDREHLAEHLRRSGLPET